MKILYIHQYFNTPKEGGSTRSYWISKKLIEEGHDVVMLTSSPNQKRRLERRVVDQIQVISLRVVHKNNMSIFRRLVAFCSFMFLSSLVGAREKGVELVIATSTPLTVGFPAMFIKFFKGTPYLFEVRDLWPEVPIQMGAIKNRFLQKLTQWFERSIYRKAEHVVALSPGMEQGVLNQGISENKVTMISNMAKIDEFWPREITAEHYNYFKLKPDTFKVIYFGAIGLANGIEYVTDAISLLKDDSSIEFIFIGSGRMLDYMQKRKESEQINNFNFLGAFNMEKTSKLVNLCDVSLVTFSDYPILATNSPNKLFDSLSAGKPIIVNNPGWTKAMVEENKCGVYADCKSPQDLADKILYLKNNPDLIKQMGENSRKLAVEKYDKSILCKQYIDVVANLNS